MLRSYAPETRLGETLCGFVGKYRNEFRHLVFEAFANRSVEIFAATTAFCEVTCAKCARYRLSQTKVGMKARGVTIE
jgi:hypothetical protein